MLVTKVLAAITMATTTFASPTPKTLNTEPDLLDPSRTTQVLEAHRAASPALLAARAAPVNTTANMNTTDDLEDTSSTAAAKDKKSKTLVVFTLLRKQGTPVAQPVGRVALPNFSAYNPFPKGADDTRFATLGIATPGISCMIHRTKNCDDKDGLVITDLKLREIPTWNRTTAEHQHT